MVITTITQLTVSSLSKDHESGAITGGCNILKRSNGDLCFFVDGQSFTVPKPNVEAFLACCVKLANTELQ